MSMGQVSKMVGARVKRTEDPRMITGAGSYTDDVQLRGTTHMEVLRSPHGHARIRGIDISQAKQSPGVIDVLAGGDINAQCKVPFPLFAILGEMHVIDRWPMAADVVRYVGEPVAVVVADSPSAARDALDLIDVDYEVLPAAVDLERSASPDAPLVHEHIGTNLCYEASGKSGDPDKAFADADAVLSVRMEQPRLVPNPMEPRAVLASYQPSSKDLTLWVTTQNPHTESSIVARMLGISESKLRVVAIDVGGAFGCKINTYSESIIASLLSMRLGRPVKWTESRQENFISTSHGRGQVQFVEAAYKKDGTILGLKLKIYADLGAYCQVLSHAIPTLTPSMAPGVYAFRNIEWTTYGVFTNKVPYDAYRGAGRPEGAYIIERVVDLVAGALGMDPVEIRRKNFIDKDAFPYETPTGMVLRQRRLPGQHGQGHRSLRLLRHAPGAGTRPPGRQDHRHWHNHDRRGVRLRPGGCHGRPLGLRKCNRAYGLYRRGNRLHRVFTPRAGGGNGLRPARRRPTWRPNGFGDDSPRGYIGCAQGRGHIGQPLHGRRGQRPGHGNSPGCPEGQRDRLCAIGHHP